MMRRLWRYARKIFGLPSLLDRLQDRRQDPTYSTQSVWQAVFSLLVTGRCSLHAIEADRKWHKQRKAEHQPPTGPPSDDTLGRVFDQLDPAVLRQMLAHVNHGLKRNKALPLIWNQRCAAVDGHEFFSR